MGDEHPAIEVADLGKRFGDVTAVQDLSFRIPRGSVSALLGANGAGKTTTLAMLLGLLLPSTGRVQVLGCDMLRHRYRALPRMNYSSPYVDLPQRLTVRQNLGIYARLYGVTAPPRRVLAVAERLDVSALLDRPYGDLSSGQRTRVSLAKSLLNQPELLLLDEPTASLDPDTADRVRTLLMDYQRETGATLLLASHNMLEVERMCGLVLVMRRGRLVDEGAPQALLARYGRESMEEVFLDIARNGAGETQP